MKKIFLIGFAHFRPELVRVVERLRDNSCEILYWVRMEEIFKIDKTKFPGTIFHNHHHAINGIPPEEVNARELPCLAYDHLREFQDTEVEVMTMMNRSFEEWPIDKRKNLYHDILTYWYGLTEKYKPDVILFHEIPHNVYDFIVYSIAKKRGVKTIMFENILRYDRLLVFEDYKSGNGEMRTLYSGGKIEQLHLDQLSEEMRNYYEDLTGSAKKATPKYMVDWPKEFRGIAGIKRRFKGIGKFFKDGTILRRGIGFLLRQIGPNLKKEYVKLQKEADFSKKFVYVPLHFQPERTSSPQGEMFVDQILMIKILSVSIPDDWKIYVKEHPCQWLPNGYKFTGSRFQGYYDEISKIDKVKIVPVETSTFSLIDNCCAVATITGIPGWEAVLRGKPALIFGYPWYRYCSGTFKVGDLSSCKMAINTITRSGYRINKEEIFGFLNALEKYSFKGFFDPYGRQVSDISEEENADNVFHSIDKILGTEIDCRQ